MEELIRQYGYIVLFIGTFAEGETILILAGFLAHRGYLQLPYVMLAAFGGTLVGDQLFYYLGYLKGVSLLKRIPAWQAKYERVLALFNRHQTPIILGFRFLYGLRSITPFVIGLSRIRPFRFLLLNAVSALTWSFVIGLLGYWIGQVLETYIARIKRYEMMIMGLMAGIGLLVWVIRWSRRKVAGKPPRRTKA